MSSKEAQHKARSYIALEYAAANIKFPYWQTDLFQAVSVVIEEAGEISKAVNDWKWKDQPIEDVRIEAAQTAAMCLRLIEAIEDGVY